LNGQIKKSLKKKLRWNSPQNLLIICWNSPQKLPIVCWNSPKKPSDHLLKFSTKKFRSFAGILHTKTFDRLPEFSTQKPSSIASRGVSQVPHHLHT
jgi:hypothetical protein